MEKILLRFASKSNKEKIDSDVIGGMSAFLCIVHCWSAPFLVGIQSMSFTHNTSEFLHSLDYIFVLMTLIAVFFAARRSVNKFISAALWGFALLFAVAIMSEEMFTFAEYVAYFASAMLIILHFWNRKLQKLACNC